MALLRADLEKPGGWALSGSLFGWGDVFIPLFDLVVFLYIPADLRMARLRAREIARYGEAAIAPGGAMHASSTAFLQWAAGYDEGDLEKDSEYRCLQHAQRVARCPPRPGAAARGRGNGRGEPRPRAGRARLGGRAPAYCFFSFSSS